MNIRLLLADDHTLMREGLKSLISQDPELSVVAEAENGTEILALARKSGAHVVVMDVAMPELNGIEATRKLLKENRNH